MNRIKTEHIDKKFVEASAKTISKKDFNKVEKKKRRLQKIMNLSFFSSQKEKLKLLLEIVQLYRKGLYKAIPWRSISAIVFTLLYIINPLDIIPDVLPLFGYVDDLSVFMALSKLIDADIEQFKIWKHGLNG